MYLKPLISLVLLAIISSSLVGCSTDDDNSVENDKFVVAFKSPSTSFSEDEIDKEIQLVFSEPAPTDGHIELTLITTDLLYGEDKDFTTTPLQKDGVISIPIESGSSKTSFILHRNANGVTPENAEQSVSFSIAAVILPNGNGSSQGNTSIEVFFSEKASLGGTVNPDIGGPNEPNQVYVSLANARQTKVRRDRWDLGFYAGDGFYVKLNSSMYMFAGALNSTNIDEVTAADVTELKAKMNFLTEGSDQYVDDPSGDLDNTAIQPIDAQDENNAVYLLKLGNDIGTNTPSQGSVAVAGDERGFMKIRVLRRNDGYELQYAELDASSHESVMIPKRAGHNFSFFSLNNHSLVEVEPAKTAWDLNFSVNTEVLDLPDGGLSAYGFSDYVTTNTLAGVKAYRVSTIDFGYDKFSKSDIDQSAFQFDQRVIGSSWREVTPPERKLFDDVFYVLEDAGGNTYKLKFTAFENENGIRGYPEFKYELLN